MGSGSSVRAIGAGCMLGMLIVLFRQWTPAEPAQAAVRAASSTEVHGAARNRPGSSGPGSAESTSAASLRRLTRRERKQKRLHAHTVAADLGAVGVGGGSCAAPPAVIPTPEHHESYYRSLGHLSALPREALDLAAPGVPARVARARGWHNEMILFTADSSMAGWGFHFVTQLRARGYEHWIILSDGPENCRGMHRQWDAMMQAHREQPLSCVYSSYPGSHPGWEQWKPGTKKGQPGVTDNMHKVYIFWATRWVAALALLRQGQNVLSLDVDAVLLGDLYARLRSYPIVWQDVLITRNEDQSGSLNCGFVYFNRDAPRLLAAAAAAGDQAAIRLSTGGESAPGVAGCAAHGGGDIVAAEWMCEMMWERLRLFLEVDRLGLDKSPNREVLWEQDAWNDLVKSLDVRKRVFPWATAYGRKSDLWAALGYARVVTDPVHHPEKWVNWNSLADARAPPFDLAAIDTSLATAGRPAQLCSFSDMYLRPNLAWIPLCEPPNVTASAGARVPAGETSGLPLGVVLRRPPRRGLLMVAPVWLASLGAGEQADWAAARPAPLTYVHITNMWKCFPHPCWSKAGRLFWLRAHGFWDKRLDVLGLTPRGAPFASETRVLALPWGAAGATLARLPEQTRALAGFPDAASRGLGLRRLHALLHNLVTLAFLIGRKPVIPRVPCDLVRALTHPTDGSASRSRFGLHHHAVVVTGQTDPVCHLMPGTWRPGASDQCYQTVAMADFDHADFVASLRGAANGSVAMRVAPSLAAGAAGAGVQQLQWPKSSRPALDLGPIRAFCREATSQVSSPILQVEGLLSLLDREEQLLVDAPLPPGEFATEAQLRRSGRPRWPSLLWKDALAKLGSDCPGAADFIDKRNTCVGFFLAE